MKKRSIILLMSMMMVVSLGACGKEVQTETEVITENMEAVDASDDEANDEKQLFGNEIIYVKESAVRTGLHGNLLSNHYYEYDENGNCISEEVYSDEGEALSKTEYTYDENNNRISKYEMVRDNYTSYRYDANNNLIERNYNGLIDKYIYNGNNQLVAQEYYGDGDTVEKTFHFEYDNNGNLSQIYWTSEYSTEPTYIRQYIYDENNNVIEYYVNDGYYEYRYDEHNKLVASDHYYLGEYVDTTEWIYDQNGMPIVVEHSNENGVYGAFEYTYREMDVPKRAEWPADDIFSAYEYGEAFEFDY